MRRAIVHIGTPRTGTTTLQRILFTHRAELSARGILYPDLTPASAAAPHLSHQHLGEALAGRRPARERRELLDRLDGLLAATSCDTVLISYEGLCKLPPFFGAPRALAALFGRHGMAMETLLTLKPQAEYLNSTYTWRMQFLREKRVFAAFVRAWIGMADGDHARLLAPWRRACGDRLIVVPVRDPRSSAPLVERVFADLALSGRADGLLSGNDRGLVENRSPGPVAIEVCRRLRAEGATFWPGADARAITRFVEQAARDAGADRAPFMGLDPDLLARIEARWGAANERFAALIWGAPWASRVLAAPPAPVNEIARAPAAPDTERLVRDIARRAAEAFGPRRPNRALAAAHAAAAIPARLLGHVRRGLRGLTRV
jgi:hypothetical protein